VGRQALDAVDQAAGGGHRLLQQVEGGDDLHQLGRAALGGQRGGQHEEGICIVSRVHL
jgi:hypothetical protein